MVIKMNIVIKAIQYATTKHEGQVRKVSKEPYITHPIAASYLLAFYKSKSTRFPELLAAMILHDVLEDTDTTFEDLVVEFGPFIATLVYELTNDEEKMKELGKLEYQKKKMHGMTSYGLTLKLIDRLANIQDNPTESYRQCTLELLSYVKEVRKLSSTQLRIMTDIIDEIKK